MTTVTLKYAHLGQFDGLGSIFQRALGQALLWQARASQRRQLAELSSAQLCDIGISREAALAEAAKPFWRD